VGVRRIKPNILSSRFDESRAFYNDVIGLDGGDGLDWILFFGTEQREVQLSVMKLDIKANVHADVSIEVDDVDAVYDRARAEGAEIVYPLTDEEWGLRRFFVRDPNGAVINVTEHQERVHLEKDLLAPPERVFAAFVDPEQLRSWWGPAGFTVQDLQFDAVEGTDYRLTMKPPTGDVFHIRGTFVAVEAPRRLAHTFVYEEPDPDDQETLVTLTFERAGSVTRLVVDQAPFRTAGRWQLHRDGWTETLERLEQFLL
jgi:uncharacterized protein YndB with AHSA1/START domain/catechol 2,3-dioxygenase-like lactoylglutathione lyase family enzyme